MNNMILILFTLIYLNNNLSNKDKNMNKIERITIKSVDFSLMTITFVDCDKFEEYFDEYKIFIFEDSLKIKKLMNLISNLEPIDSTYSKDINTRSKIELIKSSETSIICIGNLSLKKDGNFYKTPQSLKDFINNLK